MIKNDRQLAITKERLRELEARLVRLKRKFARPDEYQFYSESTRDTVALMKQEIRDFRLVQSGAVGKILRLWAKRGAMVPAGKMDLSLGELIAMLRIARGLTQEQLASRLGIQQANLARYEQRGYSGYTVETLSKIFTALGVKLSLEPLAPSTVA